MSTSKRASLPGADELFRKTAGEEPDVRPEVVPKETSLQVAEVTKRRVPKPRHEEKVTFYCTVDDLTRLERVRLELRAGLGLSSDRGKIIRAALTEALEDFESRGAKSALVKRLDD